MPISAQLAAILDRLSGVTPVLLTMTLSASVAALAVMALRLALVRLPRPYLHVLWFVLCVRMLCPIGLTGPVSLIPEPVGSGQAAEFILTQGKTDGMTPERPEIGPGTGTPETRDGVSLGELFPVIWLTGVTAMLLWAGVSYGRLRRRVADSVKLEGNVYESDRIDAPFVLGYFPPKIYLPAGLSEADRRYVLLHERTHIAGQDHWCKLLAWTALSVHWFNPVLWLAYRLFCRDVETGCDQQVIEGFDPSARREDTAGYAAALLHLGRRGRPPRAVLLPFGEESAKGRIKTVLRYRRPARWMEAGGVLLCAAVGLLLLTDPVAEAVPMPSHEVSIVQTVGPNAETMEDEREMPPEEVTGPETAVETAAVPVRAAALPSSGGPARKTNSEAPAQADAPPAYDENGGGAETGEEDRGTYPETVPAETEWFEPEEPYVVDLSPVYVPAPERELPDSLDLDFTKQEGAE